MGHLKFIQLSTWIMILLIVSCGVSIANVPEKINYQGYLTDGEYPLDGMYDMTFRFYDNLTGDDPIWEEIHSAEVSQPVIIEKGIYNVILGQFIPLTKEIFSTDLFLGIKIGNDTEMKPRMQLTSVPFSMESAHSDDSAMLDGQGPETYNQSNHLEDNTNPHGVTAEQTGAVDSATYSIHTADSSAHHTKTISFAELTDAIADGQIPEGIARDNELTWSNLSGVPEDFNDGIDNDSGGDITSVTAGTGLNGGSVSGDTVLNVNVPLELSGNTAATQAVIKGENTGNGYGVYGWSSNNFGVWGYSSAASGVYGYSGTAAGVTGINGDTGNNGSLGTPAYGVYGHAANSNSLAGYFSGNTKIENGTLEFFNRTGESWINILRGTNQNGGIAFKEEGETAARWFFPYFRGWKNDNLIIRDEIANIDVMTFQAGTGRVCIGARQEPESLVHISSGTSGDATLILEADTDNNNENDQPSIIFRQDGGLITSQIGHTDGNNNLSIKTDNQIDIAIKNPSTDQYETVTTIDSTGVHPINGCLVIGAADFTPTSHNVQYSNNITLMHNGNNFEPAKLTAPVHLPKGAKILEFIGHFADVDGDNDVENTEENRLNNLDGVQLTFSKLTLSDNEITHIITMNTETSGISDWNITLTESFTPGNIIVDNSNYIYFLTVVLDSLPEGYCCVNEKERFVSAKIIYSY